MTEAEWLACDDPDRLFSWLLHCGPDFSEDQTDELVRRGFRRVVKQSEGVGDPTRLAVVQGALGDERQCQIRLLRDIFGNPFSPITFSASWSTDTALSLARTMYDSRDFSAMPILADAFQDAGCDNDDILNHCRDASAAHVRGCWVIDLLLGNR